jgi:hypothetical protein
MKRTLCAISSIFLATGCSETPDSSYQSKEGSIASELASSKFSSKRAVRSRVESLIAACMAREGFKYLPKPPVDPNQQNQYGFVDSLEYSQSDPNKKAFDSMASTERGAFELALNGPENELGMPGGCVKQSIYGPVSDSDLQKFFRTVSTARTRTEASPMLRRARAEWSTCMATAGFPNVKDTPSIQAIVTSKYLTFAKDAPEREVSAAQFEVLRQTETELFTIDQRCSAPYAELYRTAERETAERFAKESAQVLDAMLRARSKAEGKQ